jgi:hypothetical protein
LIETAWFTVLGGDLACFVPTRKSFHAEVEEISTLETLEGIGIR